MIPILTPAHRRSCSESKSSIIGSRCPSLEQIPNWRGFVINIAAEIWEIVAPGDQSLVVIFPSLKTSSAIHVFRSLSRIALALTLEFCSLGETNVILIVIMCQIFLFLFLFSHSTPNFASFRRFQPPFHSFNSALSVDGISRLYFNHECSSGTRISVFTSRCLIAYAGFPPTPRSERKSCYLSQSHTLNHST